jgi:hypothetical protein
MELKLCYQEFHEADLTGQPPTLPSSLSSLFTSPNHQKKKTHNRRSGNVEVTHFSDSSSSGETESDGEGEDDDVVDSIDKYLQQASQTRSLKSVNKSQPNSTHHQHDEDTGLREADLTHLLPQTSTPPPAAPRRNSLEIVKARPLQMRSSTNTKPPQPQPQPQPSPSAPAPPTPSSPSPSRNIVEVSPRDPVTVSTPPLHPPQGSDYDLEDILRVSSDHFSEHSTEHSTGERSFPFPEDSQSPLLETPLPTATGAAAEWVHDYISSLRDNRYRDQQQQQAAHSNGHSYLPPHSNLSPDQHHRSRHFTRSESMRMYESMSSFQNLPPAINESMQRQQSFSGDPYRDRDVYHGSPTPPSAAGHSPSLGLRTKGKYLCRDTLITGREHGVFTSRERDRESHCGHGEDEDHHLMTTAGGALGEKKKLLHPLQRALKNHSSQLAHPSSAYSPNNISKLTSHPPHQSCSPPSLNHSSSKSFSRESQRTLPANQRYLVGVTTASASKTKKCISTPMGAVRGTQEWK